MAQPPAEKPATVPAVTAVKPERKTVRKVIEQPGHIEAFEQTPIFVKIAGFVRKVHVDIGDKVKEGAILAELSVPELDEERKQKQALTKQAAAEIVQAEAARTAAEANVETAKALVGEAEAGRKRAKAHFERWESEYRRIQQLVQSRAIDEQTRDESLNQFRAAESSRDEAEARILSTKAAQRESEAKLVKAQADIETALARKDVAEADARRVQAMLDYTTVKAPFAGIITRRHIDTGHFLQPASGSKGEPLFVLAQLDTVRVFVDVPELDAVWVEKGPKARVRVQGLAGRDFHEPIARTARALDPRSRTLLTEIDLPNADGRLRPGMYATAAITVEHPDVWTLPVAAVTHQSGETICWRVVDGKAVRTPLRLGLSGGGFVEVLEMQTAPDTWEKCQGTEMVASGNLGGLTHGQAVLVESK